MNTTTTNTAAASLSVDELALIREEAARIADDWAEQQPTEPTRKEADAEFVRAILRLCASTPQADAAPRFSVTYCSQCGQEFGPGDSGFSHCRNHRGMARARSQRDSQTEATPSAEAIVLAAKEFATRYAGASHGERRIAEQEFRAAIAAAEAQEAIYQVYFSHGWLDVDEKDYGGLSGDKRIVCAAPLPRVAATVASPVDSLVSFHAEQLEGNPYCYFELAYTRQTGWMAWITDRPAQGEPGTAAYAKSRKVIVRGQGETAQEACEDALSLISAAPNVEQA